MECDSPIQLHAAGSALVAKRRDGGGRHCGMRFEIDGVVRLYG